MKCPKARALSFAALCLVVTFLACQLEMPGRRSFTAFSELAPTSAQSRSGLQQSGFALSENDEATRARASRVYSRMPIAFEANCGQVDSQVKFLSRGGGYTLFLTSTEAVMMLRSQESKVRSQKSGVRSQNELALITKRRSITPDHRPPATATLRMTLTGSNPEPVIEGIDPLPGRSNYITGNDPGKWQDNVAQYAGVKSTDVYPGIDLIHHGEQGRLEYDFVLSPAADPKTINLSFEGAQRMRIDSDGDLVMKADAGEIRQPRPVAYQEIEGGRRPVECHFTINARSEVGFELGEYDANRPLVIDPVLSYSTYLGIDAVVERVDFDVLETFSAFLDIDQAGNVYVVGVTDSSDFPTTEGAFQRKFGGDLDVFVTKLDTRGAAIYSTYIGGSSLDVFNFVQFDASGNAYVVGETDSSDFPTTEGAFQRKFGGGGRDLFVTKLDASGAAIYSTYLGGSGFETRSFINGLEVDTSGNVYVAGESGSSDFPTTEGAFQRKFGGGGRDLFVTKLDASGAAMYSTYLGGSGFEFLSLLQLDALGNIYLAGATDSSGFPTTAGAFQRKVGGHGDEFVTKLDASGAVIYSTYLGGKQREFSTFFRVDESGDVYLAGVTFSFDFPTTAGVFQRNFGVGVSRDFVTKLDARGAAIYSTYVGGSNLPSLVGFGPVDFVQLDVSGNIYVAGVTESSDFPTTEGAIQRNYGGFSDVFVTKLGVSGEAIYSTYLGGSGLDVLSSLQLDRSGNAYVVGVTDSSDFPTRFPLQPVNGGLFFEDTFVTAINAAGSLLYSTYLGGRGTDVTLGSAVDSSGRVYVLGRTGSPDFPITPGAFQSKKRGDFNGFITKIEPPNETGILRIVSASVIRETLYVVGEGFDQKATLTLDGEKQKTRMKERDQTVLITKDAGKRIERGQTVAIRVRNSDGRLSDVFNFTRPR
jgi:hypothetical protein